MSTHKPAPNVWRDGHKNTSGGSTYEMSKYLKTIYRVAEVLKKLLLYCYLDRCTFFLTSGRPGILGLFQVPSHGESIQLACFVSPSIQLQPTQQGDSSICMWTFQSSYPRSIHIPAHPSPAYNVPLVNSQGYGYAH